jgi:multiple sugar transport system ATP-binding protein
MAASLSIRNVEKSFGRKRVLQGIDFEAKPGEFIVLVGPSGCGKSTILRAIAGLEEINSGEIWIGGTNVAAKAPKDRDIAMVFQDYALYPHKSVFENIAFGLRMRGAPTDQIEKSVREVAAKLGLESLLERKPAALSGGQRQRVAIGRAIVRDPKVFLFDEPLSNLDAQLRVSMRQTIAKLHKELGTTIVYVTHDQVEAMTLADRIVVMKNGVVQQIGDPLSLYYHPVNSFVASFIGSPQMNLISGRYALDQSGCPGIKTEVDQFLPFPPKFHELVKKHCAHSTNVIWGIRPENFAVRAVQSNPEDGSYDAQVVVTELLGATTHVLCSVKGIECNINLPAPFRPARGERLELALTSKHLYLFDQDTGANLLPD